jgi:hypothetical protein
MLIPLFVLGDCGFQRFVKFCIACANNAGFTVMLPPMRANEGNKLQLYMYMSGP